MKHGLHRLVYRSRIALGPDPDERALEVDRIVEAARARNRGRGLCGVLLTSDSHFLQVLEGPLKPLAETFERICRDFRHRELTVVDFERVEERRFSDWDLAALRRSDAADDAGADLTGGWKTIESLLAELETEVADAPARSAPADGTETTSPDAG